MPKSNPSRITIGRTAGYLTALVSSMERQGVTEKHLKDYFSKLMSKNKARNKTYGKVLIFIKEKL